MQMIAEIVYGNLISKQTLLEAFDLAETTAPRISAVGAGGKTTTLKRLAAEYTDMGRKPIVTTTTHLFREDSPLFLEDPSVGEILALLDKEGCVFAGGKAGNGKITSTPCRCWRRRPTRPPTTRTRAWDIFSNTPGEKSACCSSTPGRSAKR